MKMEADYFQINVQFVIAKIFKYPNFLINIK